jgi:RND family efflux transporter MFP subunit
LDFNGHLEAAQTAEVRTRVTGQVVKVNFKPGAMVKQGDVLFEIDPSIFRAELGKREADVRLAQVRVSRAVADFKNAKDLSPAERQRLEAQQLEAEATLAAAKEGLMVAKLNLAATQVTAPISGKIGRPLIAVGSLAADSMALATIDSVDPMCVVFEVDQKSVLSLRRNPPRVLGEPALPVLIELSDEKGFPHTSKVESADTRIDPATGTARWRAMLPNPDGLLMPGMFVMVRLITSDPYEAVLIPGTARHYEGQQPYVFIVNDQNVVQRRAIETGDREDDGMIVVKKGLTADDWVFDPGRPPFGFVRDGMTVKPQKTPPTAPLAKDQQSSPPSAKPAEKGSPKGKLPEAKKP